jgi:hypothetical protein
VVAAEPEVELVLVLVPVPALVPVPVPVPVLVPVPAVELRVVECPRFRLRCRRPRHLRNLPRSSRQVQGSK